MSGLPRVGGFQLRRPIGRGGMGVVYLADHVATGHPAAVKLLQAGGRYRERSFETEVAAVAALDHPHIVRVFDQGRVEVSATGAGLDGLVEGAPWIALELLGGGSARSIAGQVPWGEMRILLEQVLLGLAHAHARGLLHRDVKPENLLRRTGTFGGWVLTDFGLAHGRGRAGIPGATYAYAAPEQLAGQQQVPATDLFALGAVAWALATGSRPYQKGQARRLGRFAPVREVPAGFEAWVRTLCHPDPSSRYEVAADALAALRSLGAPEATVRMPVPSAEQADAPTELLPVAWRPEGFHEDPAPPVAPWPRAWHRPRPVPPDVPLAGAGLGTFALRELPVVGRDDEQDAFWGVLDRTRRDGAQGLWLKGERGVGVQAVLRSFVGHAAELGAANVVVLGSHRPLQRLVDGVRGVRPLDDVLSTLGVSEAARRSVPAALGLDHLDPVWLHTLLPWGARRRPLIVWARTPEALSALGEWLATAPRSSVLLVGAAEGPSMPPEGWEELVIPRLGPGAMRRFVEALLPLAPTAASWLVDETDGRPSDAVAIVETWVAERRLHAGPEGFAPTGPLARPVDGAAVARWRAWVARCTVREREAVEALAVLGRPAAHGVADAVAGRPLEPVLGRLVARGLVDDEGDVVGVHPALAEGARVLLSPERGRHLHGQAAEVLEALGPWRDVAGQVGWHRWQAGQPGRAVEALLDGADAARVGGRLDEALVLLDHAQSAVTAADPEATEASARSRLAWLRGWTLESQGHPDAAADALRRAVALAEVAADRDAVMTAQRARAGYLRRRGDVDGAMRCVLAARMDADDAESSPAHVGALYLELGLVHRAVGDRVASHDALREALARIPEDQPLYGDALYFLALNALDAEDLEAGVTHAQGAMGAYSRLGMMGGMGAVHDVLATVARRRGHLQEAEAQLRASASLHFGSLDRAVGLANLGLVRIALGQHAAAAEALWEALERFRQLRFARMEALAHAALLGPLAAMGRWDVLQHHLEEAKRQLGTELVDPDVAEVVLAAAERLRDAGRQGLVDEALTVASSLIGPHDTARRSRLVALRASR